MNGVFFKCFKEKCLYGFSCIDIWKIKVCCLGELKEK